MATKKPPKGSQITIRSVEQIAAKPKPKTVNEITKTKRMKIDDHTMDSNTLFKETWDE